MVERRERVVRGENRKERKGTERREEKGESRERREERQERGRKNNDRERVWYESRNFSQRENNRVDQYISFFTDFISDRSVYLSFLG